MNLHVLSAGERPQVGSLEPMALARHYVEHHGRDGQGRLIVRFWRGSFWRYEMGRYHELDHEAVKAECYSLLEASDYPKAVGDSIRHVRVVPKRSMVAELTSALPACGLLVEGEGDRWLGNVHNCGHPAHEIAPCRNGLLWLPGPELLPATPEFFSARSLGCGYEPKATAPHFLAWLTEIMPDEDSRLTLQEFIGYLLTQQTEQQKALINVGPPRSGKGTLGRLVTRLLGPESVCAPTLAALSERFGLQSLVGRSLALVSDARLGGRSDQHALAERILSLTGEDSVDVDRKHRDPITVRLRTRLWILSNELPRIADASGALSSRFLILETPNSFLGREDHGLEDRLGDELPGILNWALEGYQRLRERGHFVQPEAGLELIEQMDALGSPVRAFVRDRCEVGPGQSEPTEALWSAWRAWCESEGRDHPGIKARFVRDLCAAVPGSRSRERRSGSTKWKVVEGVALREVNHGAA